MPAHARCSTPSHALRRLLTLRAHSRHAQAQFLLDTSRNPDDLEELLWAFVSDARRPGSSAAAARGRLPTFRGRERRAPLRAAWEAARTGAPEALEQALAGAEDGSGAQFYCLLYTGLLAEADGDAVRAREYISRAARSPYAARSGDYMGALAINHAQLRGFDAGA